MVNALTVEQRRALHVLGYLLFRMGRGESAARIYGALATLTAAPDRQVLAALSALAIERGDGAQALTWLRTAMNGPLPARYAVLHLLKAQALWLEGRKAEARAARDEYAFLSGGGKSA